MERRELIRLAGAAGLAAAVGTTLAVAAPTPAYASQAGWRWCRQCQGLWFAGNPTTGVCPANTAGHSFVSSGNYEVFTLWDWDGDQFGWAWCNRCEGLWFWGNDVPGVCPAGGGHVDEGSDIYKLNKDGGGGQPNWRWCRLCQGLWFAANGTGGVCPANGTGGHSLSGSGNYYVDVS